MSNYTFKLFVDQILGRFADRYSNAQKWLDDEVLADCEPYVPYLSGDLNNSARRATNIGSGTLTYNVPYAAAQYYHHPNKNPGGPHAPLACIEWFETAKQIHLKKWTKGVQKLVGR